MSSYEIMRQFNTPNSSTPRRHVYRMIRSLSGQVAIGKRHYIRSRPSYFTITLKPKCLERLVKLETERNKDFHQILDRNIGKTLSSSFAQVTYEDQQAIDEVEKMCSDSGNHRYHLNIRGLLLFLYIESQSKIHAGRKGKIKEVIENPIIKAVAPFLSYWNDFEQAGFDTIKTLETIANELRNYVVDEKIEDDYLLLKFTERYSNEISGYFYLYDLLGILADRVKRRNPEHFRKYIELDIPNKLVEYRLRMLITQKELLSKELARIEQHIKSEVS